MSKKYTFIELVVAISIIGTITLLLSSLFYTSTFFSYKGMQEIKMTNYINSNISQMSKEFKNATTEIVEENSISLRMNDGTYIYYLYKDGILYKNNEKFMEYINDLTFLYQNDLLTIKLNFDNNITNINIPYNIYIMKPI